MLPSKKSFLKQVLRHSVVAWSLLPLTLSSAQITLDGSVGPKGALQGPNFTIDAKVGRQVGTNLFHSFGQFNIHTDESATFTGPDAIRNVLGRVTGGQASEIDGTLRSEMPNAALYLLNPAGVMFGPNATLDVPGSFHVSTADYLKLSDGGRFAATQPETSVLTSAPPAAFGFLGPNPAPITIQGSTLQAATEQTLSIVGGDVTISGGYVSAPGGQMTVASVGSAGEVSVPTVATTEPVTLSGFTRMGKLELKEGAVIDGSDRGGGIELEGGQIALRDGSKVQSGRLLEFVDLAGREIRVRGTESVTLMGQDENGEASRISTIRVSARAAGKVIVEAPHVLVDGGEITSQGGNVEVSGQQIDVVNGGGISSSTNEAEGQVSVTASEQVTVSGHISSGNQIPRMSGGAGNVIVQAPHVVVDGGSIFTGPSPYFNGPGGEVEVSGQQIDVVNGGSINSFSVAGQAIFGRNVTVRGTGGVTVRQGGVGSGGGKVLVQAPHVLVDGGAIGSAGSFVGSGGEVAVNGQEIAIVNGSRISTSTNGIGDAGTVTVTASKQITVQGQGSITSDGFLGAGGNVIVQAPHVVVDGGLITAEAGFPGHGGNVEVSGQQIEVVNGGTISSSTLLAPGSGDAGTVTVRADTLRIAGQDTQGNRSGVIANTLSDGRGGDVNIQARTLLLDADGEISATSMGSGDAGRLTVKVADKLQMTDGRISTQAQQAGGGNITVQVGGVLDMVRGELTTTVQGGSGNAGNIEVTAPTVVLNNSTVRAKADAGKGGNITIGAEVFLASSDSVVDASAGPAGINGTVDIRGVISDLSASLKPLSQEYQPAVVLAANRCAGRIREGATSSFVVTGRGGVPLQPGGLLPSASLITAQQQKTGRTETHQDSSVVEQYLPTTWIALNDGCAWTEEQ